jgi:hypothetical protein
MDQYAQEKTQAFLPGVLIAPATTRAPDARLTPASTHPAHATAHAARERPSQHRACEGRGRERPVACPGHHRGRQHVAQGAFQCPCNQAATQPGAEHATEPGAGKETYAPGDPAA